MTENAPVFETHDVLNQPPPMGDVNLYEADAVMRDAVAREGGGDASKALSAYGEVAGSRRWRGSPTRTRRSCAHTMKRAAGSIWSNSTRPITN